MPEREPTRVLRGSRKHVLDWTSRTEVVNEILQLAKPVECRATSVSRWMPKGHAEPDEARLERFGPRCLPDHPAWAELQSWWLRHTRGANTPNWDLALQCDVEGSPGLILVEAKANVPELSSLGKPQSDTASPNSRENHEQIGAAIAQVAAEMSVLIPGLAIHRDHSYQLSNRIAFAWKLASLGIPTVLIYLGFVGDEGIRDAGEPFRSEAHWDTIFREHLAAVCPNPTAILEQRLATRAAPMWLLSRSRPVLEPSPSRGALAL
jgi:hypothetical protein